MCGVTTGERHQYDGRKARVHQEHIVDKSMGGTDDPLNFRAICSVCKEGISNLSIERPQAIELLTQIRRALPTDQLDVLKWIIQKFPLQAKKLLED
jgi:hypothetical protein